MGDFMFIALIINLEANVKLDKTIRKHIFTLLRFTTLLQVSVDGFPIFESLPKRLRIYFIEYQASHGID